MYLASDIDTALRETRTVFDVPGRPGFTVLTQPWTLLPVDGMIADVLDLTDRAVQDEIGTSLQELTGDWLVQQERYLLGKSATLPPTQSLGMAAGECGVIAGLKYPSAKRVDQGISYLVLVERLALSASNYLEVVDPTRRLTQRLP